MGGTSSNGRTAGAVTALAVLVIGLSGLGLAMSPGTSASGGHGSGGHGSAAGHSGAGVHGGSGGHGGSGDHTGSNDPPPWVWAHPRCGRTARRPCPTGTPAPRDGPGSSWPAAPTRTRRRSDPIVWFGQADRSHRHDFYGSTLTGDSSTAEQLEGSPTTCNKPGDSAAYWQPTLYDDGRPVEPVQIQAYYRVAPGIEPTDVRPFPSGLTLIAGDALATTPQHGEAAGWTCGTRTALTPAPTECSPTAPLHMVLTFPDCWDGTNLNSADHRSHATYSRDGACPADHPVSVPQLTVAVKYPISGPGHDLTLASGNVYSAHGDFLNAWDPDALRREVEHCLHRDVGLRPRLQPRGGRSLLHLLRRGGAGAFSRRPGRHRSCLRWWSRAVSSSRGSHPPCRR